MEYKAQYQEYLRQATAALDAASARFLPEESEVCRACWAVESASARF